MFMCNLCKVAINPSASHPKDQELSCTKCGKLYHKKCTDRRKTTANWRKSPWYCHECVLGPQPQLPIPDHIVAANTASLDPDARVFQPQSDYNFSSGSLTPIFPQLQSDHMSGQQSRITTVPSLPPLPQPDTALEPPNDEPSHPQPEQTSGELLQNLPQPNQQFSRQVFPSTSTRQRSSNINLEHPEFEFQKTALSACRSIIAQQEVELKRLNEAVDIRNKRILLLESQIGHASEFAASRDNSNNSSGNHHTVLDRIDDIERKLNSIVPAPSSNSIVINTCQSSSPILKESKIAMTQTNLTCCKCPKPDVQSPGSNHDGATEIVNIHQEEEDAQATLLTPNSL